MKLLSNVQAARKLGISSMSLGRYIKSGKIPAPKMLQAGNKTLHGWTEEDIEHVHQLLPKIANGRKTRYSKLRERQKAQPKKAAPRKTRKKKSP
jgi:predicted DNA-binding transcriptional regulator AlpA